MHHSVADYRKFLRRLTAGIALACLAHATPAPALERGEASPCERHFPRYERKLGIPMYLLHAIAQTESGTYFPGAGRTVAWPWAVQANGEGYYFPSKADAVAFVEGLQAKGETNVDVGCMQVNLRYHGASFASVADALDPAQNVAFAAHYLKQQYSQLGSWRHAAAAYHSRTPDKGGSYAHKVILRWADLIAGLSAEQPRTGDRRALARLELPSNPSSLWEEMPRHAREPSLKEQRVRQKNERDLIQISVPETAPAEPAPAPAAPVADLPPETPEQIAARQQPASPTLEIQPVATTLPATTDPIATPAEPGTTPQNPLPYLDTAGAMTGVWNLAKEQKNKTVPYDNLLPGKSERDGITMIFAY